MLAADMRGKARARWVMAAYAHMIASSRRAAEILREHGVHAATDVTGFGLIGHLLEMVRASDVDVTMGSIFRIADSATRLCFVAGRCDTSRESCSARWPLSFV